MKRILLTACTAVMLLFVAASAFAQQSASTTYPANYIQKTVLNSMNGNQTQTFPISIGNRTHQLTFIPPSTVSALTVTVSAAGGDGSFSTVGTSTAAAGATINFTGTYQQVRVAITGYTGTGYTKFEYWGVNGVAASGSGGPSGTAQILDGVGGVNKAQVNASSQLSVVCANCSGSGVSQVDNSGFTPGTTVFVPVGAEVDDTGTTAASENSAGVARMTTQRSLHVNLRSGATEVGTAGAPLRTDPTGSTTQPVSGTVTANAGSGTFTVGGTVTANAGTGTFTSGGVAADGAAVSGNPVRMAGKDGSGNTQDIITDTTGNQVIVGAGTAGAPAGGVVSIQGVGSGTAVPISGSITCSNCSGTGVSVNEDVASANGDPGTPSYAIRQDTPANATSADGDYAPLKVDSVGRLWTNGSGVTQPVSGSVTVTGTVGGTGTFTVGGVVAADAAVSGNPVYVGGRGSTALPTAMSSDGDMTPVWTSLNGAVNTILRQTDGSAVPLATGGSGIIDSNTTRVVQATDDPMFGTAGSSSAQVITVQGRASMTPIASTESQVITDNAGFTDGTSKVFPIGYIFDEVAGTALTENDAAAGRINANRAQVMTIEDGTTRGQRAAVNGSGQLSVVCANCSGTGVSVNEDVASANADPGTPAYAVRQDTISNLTSTDGDYAPLKVNSVGRLYVESAQATAANLNATVVGTGTFVSQATPNAATSGGATIGSFLSDNSNTEVIIKASAGQLYGLTVTNKLAAPMYVRAYNLTDPDCTSATGIVGRWIVPAPSDNSGSGFVQPITIGAVFSTGISLCVTTTVSDTNNTAIGTGNAAVTYLFK